jgi:hypothetical protein
MFSTRVLRHAEREVRLKAPDGSDVMHVSGVAELTPQFIGTGAAFRRDSVELPAGLAIWDHVSQANATAALASVSNEGVADNAGWATDRTVVVPGFVGADGRLRLRVDLAVRDSDGHLARFAYTATAVGTISQRVLLDDPDLVP